MKTLKEKELFVKQPIHQAVASYGQGFSVTPLKLAQLHALIANGGYLVKPHIKKSLRSKEANDYSYKSEVNMLSPTVTKTVLTKGFPAVNSKFTACEVPELLPASVICVIAAPVISAYVQGEVADDCTLQSIVPLEPITPAFTIRTPL